MVTGIDELGEIFATFRQDSGNVAHGIRIADERYFVKGRRDPTEGPLPEELRNAAYIAKRVTHPGMPKLEEVIESAAGPILLYRWVDGELLGIRGSAHQRFRELPANVIQSALDTVYDVHRALAADGWIAVDFYDGSLIYDFETGRINVIDFDCYRHGPFVNDMGRMYGSDRFMAPEEFQLGARIDQRTTVFVLGRTALVFLAAGRLERAEFRGSDRLFDVVSHACRSDPAARFATVADFHDAWRAARN